MGEKAWIWSRIQHILDPYPDSVILNLHILRTSCCRSEKEKAELTASCQQLKLSSESVKAQLTSLELQLAELRAAANTSSAVLDDSLEAGDNQQKEVS